MCFFILDGVKNEKFAKETRSERKMERERESERQTKKAEEVHLQQTIFFHAEHIKKVFAFYTLTRARTLSLAYQSFTIYGNFHWKCYGPPTCFLMYSLPFHSSHSLRHYYAYILFVFIFIVAAFYASSNTLVRMNLSLYPYIFCISFLFSRIKMVEITCKYFWSLHYAYGHIYIKYTYITHIPQTCDIPEIRFQCVKLVRMRHKSVVRLLTFRACVCVCVSTRACVGQFIF